jgi:Uncharacterized protein conserved in bacteria
MAKKSITVLSVPELLKRVKNKPIIREIPDDEIDCSDIPEMTPEQLSKFKRRGRPVIGEMARKPISIRIDEVVLKKLKAKAKKQKIPYQSLINDILKKAV